jgi:hypothetical protein
MDRGKESVKKNILKTRKIWFGVRSLLDLRLHINKLSTIENYDVIE